MRRLITLISAGRNRIIVIRRELPRTEDAGWVTKPYRTKHRRILRSVRPNPVTGTAAEFISSPEITCVGRCRPTGGGTSVEPGQREPAIFSYEEKVFLHRRQDQSRPSAASRKDRRAWTGGGDAAQRKRRKWQACLGGLSLLALRFRSNGDGPDKAQQLAANGGDDLRFILSFGSQFLIARAQPPLCFPSDGFGFFIQALLAFGQPAPDPGFVLIGPGGFHDHASEVRIAGFGNAAALDA